MIGIQNKGKISLCNLGDSGFQLYRQTQNQIYLAYRSKEQTHSFNIPYQLSVLPTDEDCQKLRQRGKVQESISLA